MEPLLPFDLVLPPRGQGSLVRELHTQLRAAILDGRLPHGFQLPSTRRLAGTLGLSRNTVTAAYDLLVAEGSISCRQSSRPVVSRLRERVKRKHPRTSGLDALINETWTRWSLRSSPRAGLPEQSFRLGIPEHRAFPHEVWRRLCGRALRAWSKNPFAYLPSEGIPELREAIAQHVAASRAVGCSAQEVIVTSGAQQAFDLLARLLVAPGRTRVAVEEPGYPPLRSALLAAGAKLVPIEVDSTGMRVEDIPEDVDVICATPSHQSPTGALLSHQRRLALLKFAEERRIAIIEDDYDGEFSFSNHPVPSLQTLDSSARVFYVGTFSKSLFPALRKGFIVSPEWAKEGLVTIKSCTDAHSESLNQSILASFISEGHLVRHLRHMRALYAGRRDVLISRMQSDLSDWLQPIQSETGMHVSATLRDPRDSRRILAAIQKCCPGAQSLDEYAMHPPLKQPGIAFGYGTIDEDNIQVAVSKLCSELSRRA